MGGPPPHAGQVGGPQMGPQQPMGPPSGYVPGHRLPPFVPGRGPYMPRGPGMQQMPPPHSMPIQIPQQKRRSSRIAIIDPQTGQEVNTSPPKDDLPGESSGSAGTSPYQHSPPSSGLRPTGGIMGHPYAPGGSSPSRQAPPFKPDMGAADFSDSEQFAPNHPYAPGRSAAIPIIDKPSSSPIVITTPPQMRAAAAAGEQAKATAEEPAKDQTAAVTDAAPVKEADKKEEKEEEKEKEGASPLPEAATKEEEKQPEKKTDAEVEAKPAEVQPTKDEAKAEEAKAEPVAQEKDKTEEEKKVAAEAAEQPAKEEPQPAKEAEPTIKEEEAAAPTFEKATEEPSKTVKQKPAAATEDGGKKASADNKKTKSGSRKATSSKKGDEGESKAAVVASSTDKKEDQPQEKKEAEEPAKKDEAEPQAEEKAAETEQDDDDWEVKAEKEDLVLQKDISLRPTYAGSNAPGSFRPTINPQADASWNGSGTKRTYDRDFLLKFQTYCRERPEGLPSVEVILGNEDKGKGGGGGGGGRGGKGGRGGGMGSSGEWSRGAQQQFSGRGGRGGPGMPGMPFAPVPGKFGAPPGLAAPIARGPGGRGGGPPGGPIRRGPKKIPGRETPPPGIMPPPEPVAPMTDNPSVWKPSRRRGDDNEEIYGKVRSILNKLTGDKFGPLSQQMVDLLKSKATDVEILREIINIIFDKALAEPGFSTMYAELCRVLEKNCPTFETNKEGKPQTFKRILLNRCQEAFEHKPHDETVDNDPLKKEEADMKQKRRMIGNIVFIGELYKEHMLTDKIMHECVFRRLLGDIKNPVEADLEALCKLMNTIGKVLDVPKAKGYMDAYFKRMKNLTQNPNIPSRIRFLLLDVLDLRANRWTSSVTEKPAKPGAGGRGGAPQQHKPAPAPAGGRGAAYRPAGAGGPSHGPHGGPRGNAEGWETVGRGGHRGGGGDRSGGGGGGGGSERGPPVTLSSGEVVLGPNQSRMGPTMGGTGAKGWRDVSKRPQDSRRDATPASRPGSGPAPAPAKGNIFAALSDISEKSPQAESRQAGRPASRDRSRSREGREPQPSPRGGDRAEKAEPLPSPRSRAEKEDESVVGPLDPETEKSIKLLLEEFLDTQDEDEARQCVDDIEATGFQPHLVKAIIVMATEKKEVVREMLLQLITHFTKKSTITAPQFVAGLRLVLEQLDDIKLDAPLAPKVVGQFMGSALLDNYLDASFVVPALEPLVESGSAISVLVGLFNFYIENTSIGETRDFVKEAGWDITSMFKTSSRNATSISEWLQVNNLDTVFPVAWAHGKLQAMLASGDDAEKILKWIDENVSREASRDEEFAQRLTRLFLEFVAARTKSISEHDKVVEEETKLFEQYAPLLKKFLSDSQAQVDCLSVVQRFCFEQNFPEGLLERLFQVLNDAEVVDEEAFREWAADKQDSFGKSQALAQLANWLNVLAEKDEEEAH